MHTMVRAFILSLLLIIGFAQSAKCQVRVTDFFNTGKNSPVCVSSANGSVFVPNDDDCNVGIVAHDPFPVIGIYAGNQDNHTWIKDNGDVEFSASAEFQKGAQFSGGVGFSGNVGFTGTVQTNQINTKSVVNAGNISTSSLNTGSFQASGNATVVGSLSSDSFYANSATIAALRVPGEAIFSSGVTVRGALAATQGLTVSAGTTVDMGGNRVTNVGAPTADSDAATKAYVDGQVGSVQGNVSSLAATVANHDARIAATEAVNSQHDAHLTAIDAVDTLQSAQIAQLQAVDTQQANQISTLQNDVFGIRQDIVGLRQDIRRANAGIAAAVAIGGTMVVPDSAATVSFNLATYRGEQGYSGVIVGRIAPKVYANVGVAGSSVKGSTTGRIGLAFGL